MPELPGVSDMRELPDMREYVVLLDDDGRAAGVADKALVHTADTPLHLAFSCYVFDSDCRLLVTQRAVDKLSFPGIWTNSVCGHPAPGESLPDAIRRRGTFELGLTLGEVSLVLPEFAYRAEAQGLVEYEMCPVYFTVLPPGADTAVTPHGDEVEAATWVPWVRFRDEVIAGERPISPWCRTQVGMLARLGDDPRGWPAADPALLPAGARA